MSMLEPGSPAAVTLGRWGMAMSLVIGAVLVVRIIREFPYLLPNRLPGLALYELGPGLILALAIGVAVIITRDSGPRLAAFTRLVLFALTPLTTGIAALGWEFAPVLQGQWL